MSLLISLWLSGLDTLHVGLMYDQFNMDRLDGDLTNIVLGPLGGPCVSLEWHMSTKYTTSTTKQTATGTKFLVKPSIF